MVRVLSGDQIPLPPFNLNLTPFCTSVLHLFLTSFLPLFNLNLTSASSGISNHGLETTVYRPLVDAISGFSADFLWLIDVDAGGFQQRKPGNFAPKH